MPAHASSSLILSLRGWTIYHVFWEASDAIAEAFVLLPGTSESFADCEQHAGIGLLHASGRILSSD